MPIRHAAATQGILSGAPVSLKIVLSALNGTEDKNLRIAAAQARVEMEDISVLPVFDDMLNGRSADEATRTAAGELLAKLGPIALPILKKSLKGGNREARQSAIRALPRIGSASLPLLGEILRNKDDPSLEAAVEALEAIDDLAAVPLLVSALDIPPYAWGFRSANKAAARILGEKREVSAIPPLTKMLCYRDEGGFRAGEMRAAAAVALGKIGHRSACSALEEALADDDLGVRTASAEALLRIDEHPPRPSTARAKSPPANRARARRAPR